MPVTSEEIKKVVGPDATKNFETKQVAVSAAESVLKGEGRRRKSRKTRKSLRKTRRRR
jgi:hypothetical protein